MTRADIEAAVRDGAACPNQVKAWTRSGMGSCQARMCALPTIDLVAKALRRSSRGGQHRYTPRPPLKPVSDLDADRRSSTRSTPALFLGRGLRTRKPGIDLFFGSADILRGRPGVSCYSRRAATALAPSRSTVGVPMGFQLDRRIVSVTPHRSSARRWRSSWRAVSIQETACRLSGSWLATSRSRARPPNGSRTCSVKPCWRRYDRAAAPTRRHRRRRGRGPADPSCAADLRLPETHGPRGATTRAGHAATDAAGRGLPGR